MTGERCSPMVFKSATQNWTFRSNQLCNIQHVQSWCEWSLPSTVFCTADVSYSTMLASCRFTHSVWSLFRHAKLSDDAVETIPGQHRSINSTGVVMPKHAGSGLNNAWLSQYHMVVYSAQRQMTMLGVWWHLAAYPGLRRLQLVWCPVKLSTWTSK